MTKHQIWEEFETRGGFNRIFKKWPLKGTFLSWLSWSHYMVNRSFFRRLYQSKTPFFPTTFSPRPNAHFFPIARIVFGTNFSANQCHFYFLKNYFGCRILREVFFSWRIVVLFSTLKNVICYSFMVIQSIRKKMQHWKCFNEIKTSCSLKYCN